MHIFEMQIQFDVSVFSCLDNYYTYLYSFIERFLIGSGRYDTFVFLYVEFALLRLQNQSYVYVFFSLSITLTVIDLFSITNRNIFRSRLVHAILSASPGMRDTPFIEKLLRL